MSQPAPESFAPPAVAPAPPPPPGHAPVLAVPAPPATPAPVVPIPQQPLAALDASVPLVAAPPTVVPAPSPSAEASVPGGAEAETKPGSAASIFDLGTGLALAIAALAWQFLAYYASEQLPSIEESGAELSRFDSTVGAMPLVGSGAGPAVGAVLAIGALAVLFRSVRTGEREPVLHAVVALVSVISILLPVLLGMLVG